MHTTIENADQWNLDKKRESVGQRRRNRISEELHDPTACTGFAWAQDSFLTLVGLFTLCLLADVTVAQDTAPSSPDLRFQSRATGHDIVSVKFSGGSVSKYVAVLQRQGDDINIVIDSNVDQVVLPQISLSNVTVANALNAIAMTAAARESGLNVRQLASSSPQAGKTVYVITASPRFDGGRPTPSSVVPKVKRLKVFSLRRLTQIDSGGVSGGYKVSAILDAIDIALKVRHDGSIGGTTTEYDGTLGLLVVYGTGEQVDIVSQVLSELSRFNDVSQAEVFRSQIRSLQNEIEELQAEMNSLSQPIS